MREFCQITLGILVILGCLYGARELSFYLSRDTGMRTQAIQNDIFNESLSHKQSTIRQLQNLKYDYSKENKEPKKSGLLDRIKYEFSEIKTEDLPEDLKKFKQSLGL
jgi:hypothetical protein